MVYYIRANVVTLTLGRVLLSLFLLRLLLKNGREAVLFKAIFNKCAGNTLPIVTELPRKRRLSKPTGNWHNSGIRTTSRIQRKRRRLRRSS